jgi:hypothetical protein
MGPNNFHLPGPLKKQLPSKRFPTDADMKQAVISWQQIRNTNFFYSGIQALVPWWDEFLNVSRDYLGVLCVPSATHVACIRQSQNTVIGIRVFVTFFLKLPCTCTNTQYSVSTTRLVHVLLTYYVYFRRDIVEKQGHG